MWLERWVPAAAAGTVVILVALRVAAAGAGPLSPLRILGGRHTCAAGSSSAPAGSRGAVSLPQALVQQIQADLSPWNESGIQLKHVEQAYCGAWNRGFRFQVRPALQQQRIQTPGHSGPSPEGKVPGPGRWQILRALLPAAQAESTWVPP